MKNNFNYVWKKHNLTIEEKEFFAKILDMLSSEDREIQLLGIELLTQEIDVSKILASSRAFPIKDKMCQFTILSWWGAVKTILDDDCYYVKYLDPSSGKWAENQNFLTQNIIYE